MEITDDHRLTLTTRSIPAPGPGEVLIRVHAAGVNRADLLQVQGLYPPPHGASDLPGLEVSGVIEQFGPTPERPTAKRHSTTQPELSVGDEVLALLPGGGYAEYVTARADHCLPAPPKLSPVEGAGLPEVAATVVSNLLHEARMQANDTLLVHGGTGGIGSFAVQFGRALEANVVTTVAGRDKAEVARTLGAGYVIDHTEEDFVERIRAWRHAGVLNGGVDVVLDVVGGPYLDRNVACLATGGRIVVIGTMRGRTGSLDLGQLMARRGRIIATTLRARAAHDKAAIMHTVHQTVWPMLASQRLRVPVGASFALEDAQAAHDLMRSGQHIGKIVLTVGS